MQVDIDRTKQIVEDAKELFLTPKAENTLLELLKLRRDIDTAITQARSSAQKILDAYKEFEQGK